MHIKITHEDWSNPGTHEVGMIKTHVVAREIQTVRGKEFRKHQSTTCLHVLFTVIYKQRCYDPKKRPSQTRVHL